MPMLLSGCARQTGLRTARALHNSRMLSAAPVMKLGSDAGATYDDLRFQHLSRTEGALGFPKVNAHYLREEMQQLPLPTADNSAGEASARHWNELEWTDEEIRDATCNHALLTWGPSRPQADLPIFRHGEGVYLYDSNGKQYLDWSSSAVCTNLGYTVPEAVRKAVDAQLASLPYMYGGLGIVPVRAKLAKLLAEICPGDINGFLFPSGGGEANEAAIRIARRYTGKHKIMTQYRSYHGGTTASLAATGDFRRRFAETGATGFVRIFNPQPNGFSWGETDEQACQRALEAMEETILGEGPDTIAAVMLESIVGAGGCLVPPQGYMEGVRALCDRYDILLICDEVMVGFGRTGKMFAFEHFDGVVPDMVTSAKGLTGALMPLSMVGMRQKLVDFFQDQPLGWGATYHAHPVALTVGYEVVKHLIQNRIVERAADMQAVMLEEIQELVSHHPSVRQGRAIGMFACLDLVKSDGHLIQKLNEPAGPAAKAFKKALTEEGIFCLFRPPLFHIAPPLIISEEELRDGFKRVSRALTVLDEVTA